MNIELLNQIKQNITDHAKAFDMKYWVNLPMRPYWGLPRISESLKTNTLAVLVNDEPPAYNEHCGTTCCLAGWCFVLTHPNTPFPESSSLLIDLARRELGISVLAARHLFDLELWPWMFYLNYQAATTPQARAEVTCRYIDWFATEYQRWNK